MCFNRQTEIRRTPYAEEDLTRRREPESLKGGRNAGGRLEISPERSNR